MAIVEVVYHINDDEFANVVFVDLLEAMQVLVYQLLILKAHYTPKFFF